MFVMHGSTQGIFTSSIANIPMLIGCRPTIDRYPPRCSLFYIKLTQTLPLLPAVLDVLMILPPAYPIFTASIAPTVYPLVNPRPTHSIPSFKK